MYWLSEGYQDQVNNCILGEDHSREQALQWKACLLIPFRRHCYKETTQSVLTLLECEEQMRSNLIKYVISAAIVIAQR